MTEAEIVVPSASTVADDADIEAVLRVLRSGVLANGPEAASLERDFGSIVGARNTIAVSSGTDALYVAGRALNLRSEIVLVSSYSFAATANAFLAVDAIVVPVDVDPTTMNMSVEALGASLIRYPNARVVVIVDLFGNTAGTDDCISLARDSGIQVIEDACQAHGALGEDGRPVGSRALLTAFSLYATKNVAAGEGGIVTTDDDELARHLLMLRNHGISPKGTFDMPGLNHRIPELSAALARSRLTKLQAANHRRREQATALASWCSAAWPDVVVPATPDSMTHVFHQFTVQLSGRETRDRVAQAMREKGIDCRVFYPYTLADLPGVVQAELPVARSLTGVSLSLPVHPGLSSLQLDTLHEAIVAVGKAPLWS